MIKKAKGLDKEGKSLMAHQCPYDDHLLSTDSKISICENRHRLVFRCDKCGRWNRSFAIYCTQCGELLGNPENWSMAHMNNQHMSALRKPISLPSNYGFCNTPIPLKNERDSDLTTGTPLPSMLTADSFLIFPNPYTKCLQIHNIVNPKNPKILEIPFEPQLGLAQTPVFWGGHLYYAKSDGIFSASLFDKRIIPLTNKPEISPVPDCAPICISMKSGKTLIVFVLSDSILLYNPFENSFIQEIPHDIRSPDRIRSPVYLSGHLIFTTEYGRLLDINLSTFQLNEADGGDAQYYFSAPVVANGQVCFEAVDKKMTRYIGRYHPDGGRVVYQPLIVDMAREAEKYPSYPTDILTAPPLSDGTRLILSDRFGKELYLYTVSSYPHDSGIQLRRLPSDEKDMVTQHSSVIVACASFISDRSIYAISQFGITNYNLDNNTSSTQPLLVEGRRDKPISAPICFGNKLFVLGQKDVFCIQI